MWARIMQQFGTLLKGSSALPDEALTQIYQVGHLTSPYRHTEWGVLHIVLLAAATSWLTVLLKKIGA